MGFFRKKKTKKGTEDTVYIKQEYFILYSDALNQM